jgi:hypothetical protein
MTRALAVGVAILLVGGPLSGAARGQEQPPQQTPQQQPPPQQQQKPDSDQPPDKPDKNDDDDPHGKSSGRLFGIFPNHTAVEGATQIESVSAGDKFKMAGLNTFDPVIFAFVGIMATVNRSYGSGAEGYFKQYAASFTDNTTGNMMTTAVLPSLLRQDPRYFLRGEGSVLGRVGYAARWSLITRGDSGHRQFNASELGGTAIAAGISNAYYPDSERTLSATATRWGLQLMWDALSNELKEFWPDVRRKLHGN